MPDNPEAYQKIKETLKEDIRREDNETLLAFIALAGIDGYELICEDANRDILEVEEPEYSVDAENIPEGKTIEDVVKAIRASTDELIDNMYNTNKLQALYRFFIGEDIGKLQPTDEEVQAEIDRQETEKAKQESEKSFSG